MEANVVGPDDSVSAVPANNCAANTAAGGITAALNTGGLVIVGNTVSRTVTSIGNRGACPLPGEATPIVTGNDH